MSRHTRFQSLHLPLRARLTLWYTLSLSIILILLAAFLYLQLRRSLLAQVDAALQLAAAQAIINLDQEGERLVFQNMENNPDAARNFSDDFVIHLLALDGAVWETFGGEDEAPTLNSPIADYTTLTAGDGQWRVYSQEVHVGDAAGWLQVLQELEPVQTTLQSLLAQMLWGLPLAIFLAGWGGLLIASRALRPVDQMTHTAQAISASDLNQRINYAGPADEIGRLAYTFDSMLDRLQMAFERERRFTGDAAHELRTPLAALKGRIGVTLSRSRKNSEYADALQDMEQQVDRLIRLSNDLLFMARLDQGHLEQLAEPIELKDFLGPVLDQVRPLAGAKSISLVETIPDNFIIKGDLDLLIRLFLNLLDNAIKYTPPGGQVTVWAREHGDVLYIGVSDTGLGIAAEHLPHLFERFYRVEEDRARPWLSNSQGGAGLGLAIAHEIARVHQGLLSVQSEVGKGTSFVVQLPTLDDSLYSLKR